MINQLLCAGEVRVQIKTLFPIVCSSTNNWTDVSTWQLGLLIAFVVISIPLLWRSSIRKYLINHLMLYACIVFIAGWILYLIGFNDEGSECNAIALFLRAAIASMEMFVSESELIEVGKEAKESQLYMSLFALTHFLAICISAAFIIHIMGVRLLSYMKMLCTWRKQQKDLYVFFDLSQESVSLAKDIYKTKKDDRNYQIIFVKTPMEESHLERFSFFHLLSFVGHRNETIEELIEIGALLTYSRKSVTIGMDENEWKNAIGLDRLRKYIKKFDIERNKYFFCLSPNEDNNINTAVALSKCYKEAKIFCRANRNSITDSLTSLNLKFIDSANLAIMELKKNVAYHPVSFIKPDTRIGIATKPFGSMIVGFGETGFEVFRFLYEFSSFVGKDTEENSFYCDIIDPEAKLLENSLYLHCPALDEKDNKNKIRNITFHEGTVDSNRSLIEELIKTVDYVVVCTDNEKENLSMGVTLLNLAYKYRHSSDKLAVFIGINDNREFKKAQEIAQYYKRCGQRDDKGRRYDFTLVPFGAMKELFTYKNIINDDVLNKAKDFYYEYQRTANLLDAEYEGTLSESPQQEWDNRETNKKKDIYGSAGLYYKNELMQKEAQDIANVWHIKTKLYLAGACNYCTSEDDACPANDRHKLLCECINTIMKKLTERMKEARKCHEKFARSHEFILEQITIYEKEHNIPLGKYKTLFENLAKCEHLRWVASNRLLGYRIFEGAKDNEKHYLQKKHACMVSNEELVSNEKLKETIKYDYNTILVSMNTTKNKSI